MANSVTSTANPSLFSTAPTLPTGFHYLLIQTGVYTYGEYNTCYQVGVVRESDNSIVWGNPFYPYDGYPSGAQMVIDEATNSYNNWNGYYLADGIATQALTAIGF